MKFNNGSFEIGWYDVPGIGQVARGWGIRKFGDGFLEARVLPREQVPPDEQHLYFVDGDYCIKIFTPGDPMRFCYGQVVQSQSQLGRHKISIPFFSDVYDWQNGKQPPTQSDAMKVRLRVNGQSGLWRDAIPLEKQTMEWETVLTEPLNYIEIEVWCLYTRQGSNGFFGDGWQLELLEHPQQASPLPPGRVGAQMFCLTENTPQLAAAGLTDIVARQGWGSLGKSIPVHPNTRLWMDKTAGYDMRRLYDWHPHDTEVAAQRLWADLSREWANDPHINHGILTPSNEPDDSDFEFVAWLADVTARFCYLARAGGYTTSIGHWAVGNPKGLTMRNGYPENVDGGRGWDVMRRFIPALVAAWEKKHYFFVNEYFFGRWNQWLGGMQNDPEENIDPYGYLLFRSKIWVDFILHPLAEQDYDGLFPEPRQEWEETLYQWLRENGPWPWIDHLPVIIGEWGASPSGEPPVGMIAGTWSEMGEAWDRVDGQQDAGLYYWHQAEWFWRRLSMDHPNVLGFCPFIWSDAHGWNSFDVAGSEFEAQLIQAVEENPAEKFTYPGELPAPDPPPPVGYVAVYELLPQDATQDEMAEVLRRTYNEKRTVGYSHEDAAYITARGLPGSMVEVWEPDRWTGGNVVQVLYDLGAPDVRVRSFETSPPDPPPPSTTPLISLHMQQEVGGWLGFIATAKPSVVKVFHPDHGSLVKERSPETKVIWRKWLADEDQEAYLYNPDKAAAAAKYLDWLRPELNQYVDCIDYVESMNEVCGTSQTRVQNAVDFDVAFCEALAASGIDVGPAVLTAPVGNPAEHQVPLLLPAARAAVAAGGIIAGHGYIGANAQADYLDSDWATSVGRQLSMWDAVFMQEDVYPTYVLGECGSVYSPNGLYWPDPGAGWRASNCLNGDWQRYLAILGRLRDKLAHWNVTHANRCLGACLFTSNLWSGWENFRIGTPEFVGLAAL